MTPSTLQAELFAQLADPFTGEALFDCCPDLAFFIKNRRAQYVVVNRELALRCGHRHKEDVLGRTADEVHPPPLGPSYRAQDDAILRTGVAILDRLELQLRHEGPTGWCLTNKLPLRNAGGRVVGLMGISRDLQAPRAAGKEFAGVARAVTHVQVHFDQPLKTLDLARMAGLSEYQFDQRIRKTFHITTGQFLLKVRMDAAVQRLRDTREPIAHIAQACGYSDQSAFTRQFRQTVGLTPIQFRRASA